DGRRNRALRLLIGAAAPLAVVGAYHAACFGSPFTTGYSFITHPAFRSGQSEGFMGIGWPRLGPLFGILFGRSRGLFYVSPLALLGVVTAVQRLRRHSGESGAKVRDPALVVGGAVFCLLVLVNAGYYLWDGGRSF